MRTTQYKIVLASNSPRRRELLAGLDVDFVVKVLPDVSEAYPDNLEVARVPQFIAKEKAAAYKVVPGELLITADTVVVLGNEVLGKPRDEADAVRMLTELSGRTHQVITGVCLTTEHEQRSFAVTTDVTFRPLTPWEIQYYVSHYRPFDKAGAYGIQEWIGYVGATSIRGSYFNVMGLPVQRINDELTAMGAFGDEG